MRRRRKYLDRRQSDNHDRWLVSYSDFITLLFAFFVVMYAISSLNEGKYRAVSESLLSAFRNAQAPASTRGPRERSGPALPAPVAPPTRAQPQGQKAPDTREAQREQMRVLARDILAALGTVARPGEVRIVQSRRGVAIEINARVLFTQGQASLQPASVAVLRRVGEILAAVRYGIRIEGYSDDVPIKTAQFPSNWELSSARASSVARLFIASGVTEGRLEVVGYGPNHPIASNASPGGRARNRRVSVVMLAAAPDEKTEIPVAGSSAGR
ncbi:MAG: flagellar motor protein MotD [Betaproteobacteria bacterium]|nr:flagellar motor protein MotD [Betaproteobacteria bacterium]